MLPYSYHSNKFRIRFQVQMRIEASIWTVSHSAKTWSWKLRKPDFLAKRMAVDHNSLWSYPTPCCVTRGSIKGPIRSHQLTEACIRLNSELMTVLMASRNLIEATILSDLSPSTASCCLWQFLDIFQLYFHSLVISQNGTTTFPFRHWISDR